MMMITRRAAKCYFVSALQNAILRRFLCKLVVDVAETIQMEFEYKNEKDDIS